MNIKLPPFYVSIAISIGLSLALSLFGCADDCLNTSGICDPTPEECPEIMIDCYDWAEDEKTWGTFKSCLEIRNECRAVEADLTDVCNEGIRVCKELANTSSAAASCDRMDEQCPDLVFRD